GRGSTQFFEGMRRAAATEFARESQRLLIGPWNHDLAAPDCSDLPSKEQTCVERGALRDSLNDEMAWFDEHLKGLPRSASSGHRVSLYLTGIHKWVNLPDWPVPGARTVEMYLDGRAKKGALREEPKEAAQTASYRLDQDDPTPFADPEVDAERIPFDNAPLQDERED